jgi:hypothetical protein
VYRNSFNSLGIFLIQNMFTILSPCAFIASVYAILGQFAARIDADDLVPIKPSRIAKTFVWSGQYRELNIFLHVTLMSDRYRDVPRPSGRRRPRGFCEHGPDGLSGISLDALERFRSSF